MATKIALVGTHGIGKTTIAHGLSFVMKLKGKNVELIAEVARTSPLPINENTTLESQLWIISTQKKREIEAEARSDFIICDRSLLDNYAYYQLAVEKSGKRDPYPHTKGEIFDWMKTYDLLLFLRPDIPLVNDGVRSVDLDFQDSIHDMVLELIAEYQRETGKVLPIIRSGASEFQCKDDIFENPDTLIKIMDVLGNLKY